MTKPLPRRAINVLLTGRHAGKGGRTPSSRASRLADIAAAYTVEELIAEPGIGPVLARKIESWLQESGRTFRMPDA